MHAYRTAKVAALLTAIATLATSGRLHAQPVAAVPVAVGAVRTRGLDAELHEATRSAVVAELAVLGAEVPARAEASDLDAGCFGDAACVRQAALEAGAGGVLELSVIRVGPIVRLNLRFFDGQTGIKAVETEATAPASGFPASYSFKSDLRRGLEALALLHPDQVRPAGAAQADEAEPAAEVAAADTASQPGAPSSAPTDTTEELSAIAADAAPAVAPTQAGAAAAAPEDTGPWSTLAWGTVGAGTLLFTGGAVAGITWIATLASLSEQCDETACPRAAQDALAVYRLSGWLAPALLGVGAVAAIGGGVGLLLAPGAPERTEAANVAGQGMAIASGAVAEGR